MSLLFYARLKLIFKALSDLTKTLRHGLSDMVDHLGGGMAGLRTSTYMKCYDSCAAKET